MPWQELTKIALLGTENSAFSEATLQDLQAHGLDVTKEAPLLLAEAVALNAQMRKAGFPLEIFDGHLPEPIAGHSEKSCSPRSMHHLHLIMEGNFSDLLPEFIYHLRTNGSVFPVSKLPALMKLPTLDQYWEQIEPTLGTTGRWLLRQHPEWRQRLEDAGDFDWNTGSREQRITLLRTLRKTTPTQVPGLLQSTWAQENYKDRAAFLAAMEQGLSLADEDFIESCLADSRREVRQEAARLLCLLPDSRLAGRMYQRAASCFVWKGGKLKLEIPQEVSEDALRDGVLKLHPDWQGGAKAGYLGQVVSVVPPERWEAFFEKTPGEILTLFAQSDWSEPLLRAITKAAVFHKAEVWRETVLEFWFENDYQALGATPESSQLLASAPAPTVNRLLRRLMEKQPGLPEEASSVFSWFQKNNAPWEIETTKLIIRRLQEWMARARQSYWQSYHYGILLKMVASRCHPSVFEDLQKNWPIFSPLWASWEKPVEDMLNTVYFRKEMIEELRDGGR